MNDPYFRSLSSGVPAKKIWNRNKDLRYEFDGEYFPFIYSSKEKNFVYIKARKRKIVKFYISDSFFDVNLGKGFKNERCKEQ